MGEMLEKSWEEIATDLVNVSDEDLEAEVAKIIKTQEIDMNAAAIVYIGWDTRYHSPILSRAVANGVIALKGNMKVTFLNLVFVTKTSCTSLNLRIIFKGIRNCDYANAALLCGVSQYEGKLRSPNRSWLYRKAR